MSDAMPTEFVPLAEDAIETSIHISEGIYIKTHKVKYANIDLPQHSHPYSHTSYIATGAVKAWKEGRFLGTFVAPIAILIEAYAKHFFATLEDRTTVLCIHSVALGEEPEIEEEHQVIGDPVQPVERLSMDGFTFQEEPIDRWYADATDLFRQHMAVTGQGLEDWSRKNLPLGRQLDGAGAMQILTARSGNGAMQGYLMSVISPSLDDPAALVAQQMTAFASPAVPGLGMKLQRLSIEALQQKGVTEILGRAGTRGSGPRMGTMYRRLGFVDAGHLYRLET